MSNTFTSELGYLFFFLFYSLLFVPSLVHVRAGYLFFSLLFSLAFSISRVVSVVSCPVYPRLLPSLTPPFVHVRFPQNLEAGYHRTAYPPSLPSADPALCSCICDERRREERRGKEREEQVNVLLVHRNHHTYRHTKSHNSGWLHISFVLIHATNT